MTALIFASFAVVIGIIGLAVIAEANRSKADYDTPAIIKIDMDRGGCSSSGDCDPDAEGKRNFEKAVKEQNEVVKRWKETDQQKPKKDETIIRPPLPGEQTPIPARSWPNKVDIPNGIPVSPFVGPGAPIEVDWKQPAKRR